MTDRPIPSNLADVLELFARAPERLRFPGVDHDALSNAATALRQAGHAVDEARAALLSAEGAMESARASMHELSVRGLRYADIFAEDDEALSAEVKALTEALIGPPPKKTRRGRKPKAAPKKREELPFDLAEDTTARGEVEAGAAAGNVSDVDRETAERDAPNAAEDTRAA